MYCVSTYKSIQLNSQLYFHFLRRERARRHHAQTSSSLLARILVNGKIMADTPAMYV
jgi:hypothetical protein